MQDSWFRISIFGLILLAASAFSDAVDPLLASLYEAREHWSPTPLPRMSTWYVTAPMAASSLRTTFFPEKNVDLKAVDQADKPVWTAKPEWSNGRVHQLGQQRLSSRYLFRTLFMAHDADVAVNLGSDDGIQVWFNGALILQRNMQRPVLPDQEKVTLHLRRGLNRLLMKVHNQAYGSGFYFALVPPRALTAVQRVLEQAHPVAAGRLLADLGPNQHEWIMGWLNRAPTRLFETHLLNSAMSRMHDHYQSDPVFRKELMATWRNMLSIAPQDPDRLPLYRALCVLDRDIAQLRIMDTAEWRALLNRIRKLAGDRLAAEVQAMEQRIADIEQARPNLNARIQRALLSCNTAEILGAAEATRRTVGLRKDLVCLLVRVHGLEEVIFAVRQPGRDRRAFAHFGYRCDNPAVKLYGRGGRLCALNLRTGQVREILRDDQGGIRDPAVHFDARKILFAWRRGDRDVYCLYEIGTDGSGLRALTQGDFDDFEPIYLPDNDLLFRSARCRRWTPDYWSPVATLYRCSPDGDNVRPISVNVTHDATPSLLADGRLLYTRWIPGGNGSAAALGLRTIRPDGFNNMARGAGTLWPAGAPLIDARPIPNSDAVIGIFMKNGDNNEKFGELALIKPGRNAKPHTISLDEERPPMGFHRGPQRWRDPYPLSADCILVARERTLCVMDGSGRYEELYTLPKETNALSNLMMLHEPRPLRPHPRAQNLARNSDAQKKTGFFVLSDVHRGRHMAGIQPGAVKKLLVLEALPKPVSFGPQSRPITMDGSRLLFRLLGETPVAPDGSAHFSAPSMRPLLFVALDANGTAVQRMPYLTSVMPGETRGCIGCHVACSTALEKSVRFAKTLKQAPAPIELIGNAPAVFDFPRDIQPVLNRQCAHCHNYTMHAGRLPLTDDCGPFFSHSYANLFTTKQIAPDRQLEVTAPYTTGSAASPLLQKLDGSHYKVSLSDHEKQILRLWIDAGAPFAGTYAALGCGMVEVNVDQDVLERRCGRCHTRKNPRFTPGPHQGFHDAYFNMERPTNSTLLAAPLMREAAGLGICHWTGDIPPDEAMAGLFATPNDTDYLTLLCDIELAAQNLLQIKRFDMPNFIPNQHYLREMHRYGLTVATNQPYMQDLRYWNLQK